MNAHVELQTYHTWSQSATQSPIPFCSVAANNRTGSASMYGKLERSQRHQVVFLVGCELVGVNVVVTLTQVRIPEGYT